jgi:hypothetical protein
VPAIEAGTWESQKVCLSLPERRLTLALQSFIPGKQADLGDYYCQILTVKRARLPFSRKPTGVSKNLRACPPVRTFFDVLRSAFVMDSAIWTTPPGQGVSERYPTWGGRCDRSARPNGRIQEDAGEACG